MNAVTRSGTNRFTGNTFEFLRDSRFNAPNFFSAQKDGLKRNQFCMTLGGPLVRDRLFFFVGYQGTTTRQTPNGTTAFVPTPAMLAGDFTAFASAACQNGRAVTLSAPFVNNRIDPALFSPAALNIARRLPQPLDECGRTLWGEPRDQDEHQLPLRIDFQLNQAHSLFGRYMLTTDDRKEPFAAANGNLLATSAAGVDDTAHSLALGHTYVINSSMVNSIRGVVNDVTMNKLGSQFFGPQEVGINAYSYVPNYVRINVANSFAVGTGSFVANIFDGKVQNRGVSDDFTLVKGSHQLALGGHYLYSNTNQVANAFSIGLYTFTGAFTGGERLLDMHRVRGRLPMCPEAAHQEIAHRQTAWRLNRVTLNYGVVWDPFFSMSFPDGDVYNFSRADFLAGKTSQVMKNAPPGFSFPGDPGFKAAVNDHFNTWAPRVALAWDLTGDGRTAVRAGAGIAHDFIKQELHLNTSSSSPFSLAVGVPSSSSLDNPWANYPGGNPFPYRYDPANPAFPAYGSYLPLPADLKPTTQYSWNIGIQRQIAARWFASGSYIGSRIVNQISAEEQNPGLFIPGNCEAGQYGLTAPGPCSTAGNVNQRRVLNLANPGVQLGSVGMYTDQGYQHYHGMLLNSRLDVGHLLNLNGNYTLSKCEGLPLPGANGLQAPAWSLLHQAYQNSGPHDLSLDKGPCLADRRHLFNLTAVVRSPDFANGVVHALASNWTASAVLQMRSGGPVNVLTGLDNALNGFFTQTGGALQRPNLVPGVDPYGDTDSLTNYYNIAAFAQPATGTLGDTPYNYLRGPGFWQWDQAFTRGFEIGNRQRLELRAEGINITNHFNRGEPAASLNNPATFGRITTLAAGATPRIWQFAVKYAF